MGKIILKMMLGLNYDMRPFHGIIISIFDKVPSKVFNTTRISQNLQGKKLKNIMNEKWEELEVRTISAIRLSFILEMKYNVLNEKFPSDL